MLDFLRTNVGFLGHMLDKCLTRTKLRQTLDICCTNARHGTKAGQKLGYHHWKPAPKSDKAHATVARPHINTRKLALTPYQNVPKCPKSKLFRSALFMNSWMKLKI